FTCGVRTNGRVEVENRVNKVIGGPKKTLKQLFDGLNERTVGQGVQELIRVRDFVGPFGLQTCFKQMENSVYYSVKALTLPDGMHDWAIRMLNTFENDNSHISTKWLLRLIKGRGLRVEHLLCITHDGTDAFHMLAILPNDNYVCDCCMGMNLGIPCRHYFRALSAMKNLRFNIGVIRPR
ncbi:hypothetical protein BDZ97DRAFT_1667355, partial [Flammula alnicola]